MTKSVKHKKQRLLEKNKVKLKAKAKKLPKGQNITNTSFKAKKIVLQEQFKASTSEPIGRRRLNVKELLAHLHHYNSNVRQHGLNGLKELVTNYPEVLSTNLSAMIEAIGEVTVDKDGSVRKDALKMLELLLSRAPLHQVTPFFDLLSAYLNCAMTHIQTDIQEDSLVFMDILLKHVPSLVTEHADKILYNFLDQISKQEDSNSERVITINLNSNMTTIKWRVQVLNRLHKLLKALLEDKQSSTQKSKKVQQVKWSKDKALYVPLYTNYASGCSLDIFSVMHMGQKVEDRVDQLRDEVSLKNYIDMLMPLLFKTWLEVGPSVLESETGPLIEEAAEVLQCVLEIMQLVWEYISWWDSEANMGTMTEWFRREYYEEFKRFFLSKFPYTLMPQSKKRKSGQSVSSRNLMNCAEQNMLICFLFCCMVEFGGSSLMQKVISYISKNLDATENAESTLKVLRYLMVDKCWSQDEVNFSPLIDSIVSYYEKASLRKRAGLRELLCSIVLNHRLRHVNRKTHLDGWLVRLPNILCEKEVSPGTIKAMARLAIQKNVSFLSSFSSKIPDILNNLPHITVTNLEPIEGQKSIVNIFYWMPDWNEGHLKCLGKHIKSAHFDKELIAYILEIFQVRKDKHPESPFALMLEKTSWWKELRGSA